jgi:deoxyribonuclease V
MAEPSPPRPSRPKLPTDEWKRTQAELAARVRIEPLSEIPRFVAGADCAFGADVIYAVALVWDREANAIADLSTVVQPLSVPYVPTFLSFREAPAVTAAIRGLKHPFGAVLFDGQGMAHPRRCGLATHIGVSLDLVAAGAAKTRLLGDHAEPGPRRGDWADLVHKREVVGCVLRTRDDVKPIYASVGHRLDLPSVRTLILACCSRYRIPEPTRLADVEVAKLKQRSSVGR